MNPVPPPAANNAALPAMPNLGNVASNLSSGINDVKNNFNTAVSDFSSKSLLDASTEFTESNTIVAKFAFLILIVIAFMLLFKVGVMIMNYAFMPSDSPYLVEGKISGNESLQISQDPKSNNPLVKLSENKESGAEFTYSVWLYLTGESNTDEKHVFTKGSYTEGIKNGAPSLYVMNGANNTMSAKIYIDTMKDNGSVASTKTSETDSIEITDVPFKKWVNIVIRLQNRIMDIYVNGVLTKRKDIGYITRQNFGDVFVCQSGGFLGNLSDLRYFAKALNVFQINQIVSGGANTSSNKATDSSKTSSKFNQFLASNFYSKNM